MNAVEPHDPPRKRLPPHRRFYLAGILTLLVGLSIAAGIYVSADGANTGSVDYGADRHASFAVERIGGKAAVWAVEFNQWLSGLWHGQQLAYTLAYLTIAVALICFLIGDSLSTRHRPR